MLNPLPCLWRSAAGAGLGVVRAAQEHKLLRGGGARQRSNPDGAWSLGQQCCHTRPGRCIPGSHVQGKRALSTAVRRGGCIKFVATVPTAWKGRAGSRTLVCRPASADRLANLSCIAGQRFPALLQDLSELCSKSSEVPSVASGQASQLYLPDRGAMGRAGLASCSSVPQGAESALVQHIPGKPGSVMLLFSERAR